MNSRMVRLIAGVVVLAVVAVGAYAVLAGGGDGGGSSASAEIGPSPTSADDSEATPEGIDTAVAGSNAFAVEAYRALLAEDENEDANLFFSPYSISSALGMTYEGAKGDTASEIAEVFGLDSDDDTRRSAAAALYNRLNPTDAPFELSTANAIWAQENYPFKQDFLDAVERYYAGKSVNLDFVGDPEGSRQTINSWVEDETNDRIKELLPAGSITEDARMVLTNAIYFLGDWAEQFDTGMTGVDPFLSPEGTVEVDVMGRSAVIDDQSGDEDLVLPGYAAVDGTQVLELPYKGEKMSLFAALPEAGTSLSSLAHSLTPETFESWRAEIQRQPVDITFPKFKLETKYQLKPTLSALGMPTAFDDVLADFTGMHDSPEQVFISDVYHDAFIQVDEKGTEAAAATAVVAIAESMPPPYPEFRADRPFLFLIQDNETGLVLFMGQVTNPAA